MAITYPIFNPVAFKIFSLPVHWYGIMYLVGFASAWSLACWRVTRLKIPGWTLTQVGDLIFYAAIGVIVGGRLGYVLFYDFPYFWANPLSVLKLWEGGMSFHGGFLGVLVSLWVYSRHIQQNFWDLTDFVAPLVPVGLAAGRIGNFINQELWGRITQEPWGMIFPNAGPDPRHPSQLYECFLEGILLFVILWGFSIKPRPRFAVSALFLLCYGIFRTIAEFFRQPDPQYGFIAFGWLTMGQLLSFPMIVIGAIALIRIYCPYKSQRDKVNKNAAVS